MKLNCILIATLCLFSACTEAPGPESDHVADEARIREVINRAVAAFGTGDAETLAAIRTEDSVVLKPEAEPLIGKQARHDSLEAVFAQFDVEESRSIKEIDITGDRAIVWGTYTVILAPKDGSPPINEAGNYIDVLHKQPDESWLFARTIWNATSLTGP
jgi:uncharacterized protein (TIGR02246 family)